MSYTSKRKEDFPCSKCGVHVKKNDKAVQCFLCTLWYHQKDSACCDVEDGLFKYLDSQVDYQGGHYWTCQQCRIVSLKLQKRFEDHDKRLAANEAKTIKNEEKIAKLEKELAQVKADAAKVKPEAGAAQTAAKTSVFKEIQERDARKHNVVVHGLPEASASVKDGKERAAKDLEKLQELLGVIELQIQASEVAKVAYRVGRKGEKPRPLVVGLKTENADLVETLTVSSKKLRLKGAPWDEMSIVSDLTAMQREEERKLYKEVEDLAKELDEEDAKNFEWKVVGPRGRKRAAKVAKAQQQVPVIAPAAGRQEGAEAAVELVRAPANRAQVPEARRSDRNKMPSASGGYRGAGAVSRRPGQCWSYLQCVIWKCP